MDRQVRNLYPPGAAALHTLSGEPDLAFEWLDRCSQTEPWLQCVNCVEWLRPLHGHPRWKARPKKMNLPVD